MQVTINVKDRVLLNVIDKMVDRSNNGIDKYSTTLEDDKSGLVFFLKQIQTELMDAVLYMERLKEELQNLQEDAAIKKIEVKYEYVRVYPQTQNRWNGDTLRPTCNG